MTIKAAIYDYLSTHATVIAQVSTRIYPDDAPTSAVRPYIVYERSAQIGVHSVNGSPASTATGLTRANVMIDAFADTSLKAEQVAEAVRDAIDGFQGTMSGVDVRHVTISNIRDSVENPEDGSEVFVHRVSLDLTIWYNRSVPSL